MASRFALVGLIGGGAAACSSDAMRFNEPFANPFASNDPSLTGSIPDQPPATPMRAGPIQSQPLAAPTGLPPRAPQVSAPVSVPPSRVPATPPVSGWSGNPAMKPGAAAAPAPVAAPPAPVAAPKHVRPGQPAAAANPASAERAAKLKTAEAPRKPEPAKAAPAKVASAKVASAKVAPAKVAEAKPAKADAKPKPEPVRAAEAPTAKAPEPQRVASADASASMAAPAAANSAFRWPARGRVIAGYGSSGNEGINIAVPEGTPVKAAEDGTVAYAGSDVKGYGKLVLIRHPNGYVSAYAHNGELDVKQGEKVRRGQNIARSGQSGNVTSPQIHFEIRKGATPIDPMPHLASN